MRVLLVLLAVALLLAVTNPSTTEFVEWAVPQVMEANFRWELERALGSVVAKPLLTSITTRRDYALFSVFTVRSGEQQTRFLGIAKQFLRLDDEELDLRQLMP